MSEIHCGRGATGCSWPMLNPSASVWLAAEARNDRALLTRHPRAALLSMQWATEALGYGGLGRRSEEMALCQLIIPAEAAHQSISLVGEVGLFQFKDLNKEKSAFQRTYANQVCGWQFAFRVG